MLDRSSLPWALLFVLVAAPVVAQTFDGSWSGSTAQGKTLSFDIAGNAITRLVFGGRFSGAGCNGDFDTTVTYTPPRALSGSSFSITVNTTAPGATSYVISGTLTSSGQASGTLSFTANAIPGVPSCSGSGSTTWTAARAGAPPLPPPEVLRGVLAVVGSAPGQPPSFFRTSVQLHNATAFPLSGRLVFHRAGASGSNSDPSLSYSLAPGQTIDYADVVAEMGLSGLGSMDLVTTSSSAPLVLTRIFNDGGVAGTSGMNLDLVPPADALSAGQSGVLIAPRDPVRARLNIGVRSLSQGANMMITIRNKGGAQVTTLSKSYGPDFFEQVRAADFLGRELGASDSVTFTMNSGSAIIYGATTDNTTNDPAAQIAYPP